MKDVAFFDWTLDIEYVLLVVLHGQTLTTPPHFIVPKRDLQSHDRSHGCQHLQLIVGAGRGPRSLG
jgi:hypothetical protein